MRDVKQPTGEAVALVLSEYGAARAKYGDQPLPELRCLRVLLGEVGEVAEALDTDHDNDIDREAHLDQELAQVAQTCLWWLSKRQDQREATT